MIQYSTYKSYTKYKRLVAISKTRSMAENYTTIRVHDGTKDLLDRLGAKGDSYDDIVSRLAEAQLEDREHENRRTAPA